MSQAFDEWLDRDDGAPVQLTIKGHTFDLPPELPWKVTRWVVEEPRSKAGLVAAVQALFDREVERDTQPAGNKRARKVKVNQLTELEKLVTTEDQMAHLVLVEVPRAYLTTSGNSSASETP